MEALALRVKWLVSEVPFHNSVIAIIPHRFLPQDETVTFILIGIDTVVFVHVRLFCLFFDVCNSPVKHLLQSVPCDQRLRRREVVLAVPFTIPEAKLQNR
jgi:hypothetical protein